MKYREQVPGKLRPLLTPGWLALHLLSVVLIVTMVLLGRWQLDVSNSKHFSLQNFGYALQWWAFSIFAALMWRRVVRDRTGRTSGQAGASDAETHLPRCPRCPTVATSCRRVRRLPLRWATASTRPTTTIWPDWPTADRPSSESPKF